jgi:3-oxoacyl-[acyl-carrier-protein] synthase I
MIGHTLGASGAMGVGFCWLSLAHRQNEKIPLPPHVWDGHSDETLPRLSIVTKRQTLADDDVVFLSNSFGFGGSNASVLLGTPR